MKNDHINFVQSTLAVKASGLDDQIANDLLLPEGKSIAELLHDQEKNDQTQITE